MRRPGIVPRAVLAWAGSFALVGAVLALRGIARHQFPFHSSSDSGLLILGWSARGAIFGGVVAFVGLAWTRARGRGWTFGRSIVPAALTLILLALPALLLGEGRRVGWEGPAAAGSSPIGEEAPAPRANVVLVSVETTRYDHLSLYGYDRETSPHLDRLAAGGMVFGMAIAQAPATYRSVAALLTGVYPWLLDEARGERPDPYLLSGFRTLAEELADHGYATHAVVSNSYLNESNGYGQGFLSYADEEGLHEGGDLRPLGGSIADRAEARIALLSEPFFLWLHFLEPHHPYHPPVPAAWESPGEPAFRALDPDFTGPDMAAVTERISQVPELEPEERERALAYLEGRYDAEILEFDRHLGRVVDLLEARGFDDRNTLIVVTADHGEEFADHDRMLHSHTLYDELLRVPLVVRGPGVTVGSVDAQVRLIDVAPTILEWVGIQSPAMHGESFASWLREPTSPRSDRLALSVRSTKYIAVRSRDRKLVVAWDLYPLEPVSWLPWRSLAEMTRISVLRPRREKIGFWRLEPGRREAEHRLPMSSAEALALYRVLERERSVRVTPEKSERQATGLTAGDRDQLRALGYAE